MEFIGRDVWGARYAAGSGARPLPCTEAWLHHTVTAHLAVDASPADEAAQMRVVEGIGQQRFGQGFSYNLAIFPSGRVYVGCGVRRVGAHTAGRNTRALGIVLVGDLDKHEVPAPMRAALVDVLRFAKAEGWLREARLNGGHRDLKQTACPGRHAYALIGAVNAEAAGQAPPAPVPAPTPPPAPAPTPAPAPAPRPPEDDEMDRLPVLKRGASGQAVRNLQGLLIAAGRPVSVDGSFGPGTEKALRAWQAAAKAPGGADGVAGPGTWGRLLGLR